MSSRYMKRINKIERALARSKTANVKALSYIITFLKCLFAATLHSFIRMLEYIVRHTEANAMAFHEKGS